MINNSNPWLGLKSYSEGDTLYGRDEDIRCLTQCVLSDRETVLYGRSGIGKTSILYAGVIPTARMHGFVPVAVRLVHDTTTTYISQICEAITKSGIEIEQIIDNNTSNDILWGLFHNNIFKINGERVKILLLFDQFEEIFTLQKNNNQRKIFFDELADVLNNVMPQVIYEVAIDEDNSNATKTDKNDDGSSPLSRILNKIKKTNTEFVTDNEINFVFTIREDFLSEFEFYTSCIPPLRQHRYQLRPINEEQAAEIIMRPRRGLVSKEVAELIIEQVTQRSDFKLDGIPEIEVEVAVLSLYLRSLFEQKTGEIITKDLVEVKGGEIIQAFYEKTISEISSESAEYLEKMLVTKKGRRDSIFESEAKDNGVTTEELTYLKQKRVLHDFKWNNYTRIEFMHDILCDTIMTRRQRQESERLAKEEHNRQEEEKKRIIEAEKLKRRELELKAMKEKEELELKASHAQRRNNRLKRLTYVLIALCLLGIVSSMYFFKKKPEIQKEFRAEFTSVNFLIDNDSLYSNTYDSWDANIKIISSDTTSWEVPLKMSNRIVSNIQDIPLIAVDSTQSITVEVTFNNNYNNYKDTVINISPQKLIADNYIVKIPIRRIVSPVKGKATMIVEKDTVPLKNSQVVLYGNITYSDNDGRFELNLPLTKGERDIPTMKHIDGLNLSNLYRNDQGEYIFEFVPNDSLKGFISKCDHVYNLYELALKEPIPHRYFNRFSTTDKDKINIYYTRPDSTGFVEGYFYFNKEAKSFNNKYLAYYYFSGYMDKKYDKIGLRSFTLFGKDAAGNEATLRAVTKRFVMYIIFSTPTSAEQIISTEKGICQKCGKFIENDWETCHNCGAELSL